MKSQIYTPTITKDLHIRQLNEFIWPFFNKIIPQFTHIEDEADRVSEEYWENMMSQSVSYDSIDPGNYAESAMERGLDHYMMLKLGLYTVTAAWHATLLEFFHQQLRLFLHNEIKHIVKIDIKKFCGDFNSIIDFIKFHNFDIKSMPCWEKIDELRWLSNVIKHGDGYSADKLREIAPHRFKEQEGTDLFQLYKSTLLEETLSIDGESLNDYLNATVIFWRELPERCYSDEI